jgi:surfactin synthase thioesterase subunit
LCSSHKLIELKNTLTESITQVPANLNKVKGVMIYGDKSKVLLRSDVKWWKKHLPHFDIVAFSGEHLFPLEHPEQTASLLKQYI